MQRSFVPYRRALERLGAKRPGVPMKDLLRLAREAAGDDFIIDFAAGRQIGVPVLVLRTPHRADCPSLPTLSPREREVALLVARGARNKQIAVELGISLATVKDHIHNALTKNGFSTRAQLAAAIGARAI